MISIIVAMAKDRVIGLNNGMPWHLPADLKHFKEITMGKPVVMGRKTFESIGKALPDRRNIVITRNPRYQAEGCETVSSLEAALALVADQAEICIIGGAQIFHDALPLVDRLYLTIIDLEVDGDTHFPKWNPDQWQETSREAFAPDPHNPYSFEFVVMERA